MSPSIGLTTSRHIAFLVVSLLSTGFLYSTRLATPALAQEATSTENGWIDLFNGEDLTGWETWLSRAPGERQLLGLNNDPLNVFTVEEGAIHVSGQVFGALTTTEEYGNYHLRLEYKWGDKKWPPRHNQARDSGVCYHATGAHGAFAGSWMKSLQFGIGEGGTGDFWSVAGSIADVEADSSGEHLIYAPGQEKITVARGRVLASSNSEKPVGEWNLIEIVAREDSIQHIVNGEVVMVLHHPRHVVEGAEQPLTRGKIQLQSEGAEIWFRNVQLMKLD